MQAEKKKSSLKGSIREVSREHPARSDARHKELVTNVPKEMNRNFQAFSSPKQPKVSFSDTHLGV